MIVTYFFEYTKTKTMLNITRFTGDSAIMSTVKYCTQRVFNNAKVCNQLQRTKKQGKNYALIDAQWHATDTLTLTLP
jgi:hypothetical protein